MINTIFYDLDGTLLPMDQDHFVKRYFRRLAAKTEALGFDSSRLADAVWGGIAAIIKNDGSRFNDEVFWEYFTGIYGREIMAARPVYDEFYRGEFGQLSCACGFNPLVKDTVRGLKSAGYTAVLATNPVFPVPATEHRIRWTGLEPEDFVHITTYENCRHCKPSLAYYTELCDELKLRPEDCLMVGNDVDEDMVAEKLGMKCFLLTDCLINKNGADIDRWPHGGFDDLQKFVAGLKAGEKEI
ncbi:MAG: HAD family hydrolase [Oscillospiraceae bacterium]|nr:HAD family hydrolase [Oscillospiraceae bacterium]